MQFFNEYAHDVNLWSVSWTQDESAEPKTYNYELFLCVWAKRETDARAFFLQKLGPGICFH